MSIKALEAAIARLEEIRLQVTEQLAEARAEVAVAELDAADKANGGGDDANLNGGTNPFQRLVRPDGTRDTKLQERVSGMILKLGTKKVVDIARSAVSADAPFGRSISGLPLAK
jgi:hypothetical protein